MVEVYISNLTKLKGDLYGCNTSRTIRPAEDSLTKNGERIQKSTTNPSDKNKKDSTCVFS
jgi:hypothetical protein